MNVETVDEAAGIISSSDDSSVEYCSSEQYSGEEFKEETESPKLLSKLSKLVKSEKRKSKANLP